MEEMCSEFDMKHYLTLIRKSDFTDLFKFGHLFIDIKGVVEFDGDTETLSQNTELRDKLFERANQFDYSFTVLIVHFKSAHLENGKLNIEEVQNIFALDNEAKREIEISYDPRINICDPIWPNAVKDLQDIFLYEDAKKGANNIWKILNIKQLISEMESFFPDENIKGIAKLVNQDKRPEGNLSFWTYLLRYERHGFFPKTTSGYFMDLINVFINTLQKKEFPSEAIEATAIYKEICRYQDLTLEPILSKLNASETGKNFIEKINEIANSQHNAFIIAILFLILRDQYKDGFSVDKNNMLINLEKKFPHEVNYSLYLLGLFLGNSHTFECLYDSIPLAIFKKNNTINKDPYIPIQPRPFRETVLEFFDNLKCLPKNKKRIQALREQLDYTLLHLEKNKVEDGFLFVTALDNQNNWKNHPSAWKALKEKFCPNYDKMMIKGTNKFTKEPTKNSSNKKEVGSPTLDLFGEEKREVREIKTNFINDYDIGTLIGDMDFLDLNLKSNILKTLIDFQEKYRPGGYYHKNANSTANNKVIEHFINVCTHPSNPYRIDKTPKNMELLEKFKILLIQYYCT